MLNKWVGGSGRNYHDFVWHAVHDSETQASFRREPVYHSILGVSEHHARLYLEQIDDRTILRILSESEEADKVGGPLTYEFAGRQLAPNTVRYAKVLQDLTRLFPSFSAFESIAEVGVGYGGQAHLISDYARIEATSLQSYDLFDILPVCFLAQGYLDHFRMHPACRYMTKSQIPRNGKWDLVVSNYAFSEFDRELEREYLDNVLLKSRCGYLTMNSGLSDSGQWEDIGQSCIGVEQLLKELPNAVVLSESPVLYPSNYMIVFGEHSAGSGVPLARMRDIERDLLAEHDQWRKGVERERQAAAENCADTQPIGLEDNGSPKTKFLSAARQVFKPFR